METMVNFRIQLWSLTAAVSTSPVSLMVQDTYTFPATGRTSSLDTFDSMSSCVVL